VRVLVVTAVAAERDAVLRGLGAIGGLGAPGSGESVPPPVSVPLPTGDQQLYRCGMFDVLAGGVGPAGAAVGAATALAVDAAAADAPGAPRPRYDLVLSAGIGGGFAPSAVPGDLVLADALVAADLGADSPEGFIPVSELGFGRSRHLPPDGLLAAFRRALADTSPGPAQGPVPGRTAQPVVGPVLTVSTATGTAARAAELAGRHPGAAAEAMEGFGVAEAAAAYGLPVGELRAVSNAVGPRDRAAWQIGPALAALTAAFAALAADPPTTADLVPAPSPNQQKGEPR
jgi:futalosine hydrolase